MGELDDLSYESIQRQNMLPHEAILYYDHILTFKSEVAHLWARPKSHSSYWFFLNRYFAFFTNIAVLTLSFTTLSAQILVCGLAGAWEALFLYDSILFSLTLYKTLKERKDNRITGINIDLVSLILRDVLRSLFNSSPESAENAVLIHAVYSVMALCNLANILTFYPALGNRQEITDRVTHLIFVYSSRISEGVSQRSPAGGYRLYRHHGTIPQHAFTTNISHLHSTSVTMMSRMMLNLHETADEGLYSTHKTSTHVDYSISQYTEPVELDTIWSGGEYPRDQSLSMGLTSIGSSSVFQAAGENETVSKRK
ncbi:hypothetical protein D9611_006684 [Ephemerocybe angulata]|uniref:DUF6533 domain-containing protein n=1 Tax=Ephemerocybe angulata TaxID=980116 RepID=A0A8H5C7F3_9AGAR|nr:hypothetical protein D9611_006684 [Tulosesus angulatus]